MIVYKNNFSFFYFLPALVFLFLSQFDMLNFDFWGTKTLYSSQSIYLAINYFFIGLILFLISSKFFIFNERFGYLDFLFPVFMFLMGVSEGYFSLIFSMLFFSAFFFKFPSYFSILLMFFVAVFFLLFLGERYLFVWVGILLMVRIRLSGFYFVLFSLLGFVMLITLLQEAKSFDGYGHGFISLSNSLYRQFSPIIINNLVGLELKVSYGDLFGSILPFGKTLFSVPGLVEKMSYYHLSSAIFNNGTRLGSASSVYFGRDYYFFNFLVIFLLVFLWFCYMKMGKRSLNVFVIYMSFYAPYFIRRGVGLYIVDLIVLLFFIAFFLFLFRSFKKV